MSIRFGIALAASLSLIGAAYAQGTLQSGTTTQTTTPLQGGGRRLRQQHHLRKAARRPGRLAQVAASMSQSLTQNDAQASRGRLSWRPPSFRVWTCCGAVQDTRPDELGQPNYVAFLAIGMVAIASADSCRLDQNAGDAPRGV